MNEFEEAAKVIIDMNNEAHELERRYGSKSRLVIKMKKQVEILSNFHDSCLRVMKKQHHELKLMRANYVASQMIRAKREGKSYQQMAKERGSDPTQWKILDEVDELIRKLNG
jgi:predicted dinucleotide-binding enzyme